MKNWMYIFMMGLVVSLVSSCQQSLDEEVQVPATIGKAKVSFTIALDDLPTRAVWSENETDGEIGSGNDNAINNLQVWLHYTNSESTAASAQVAINSFYKVAGSENIYKVEGTLTINDLSSETLDCRLEVFANSIKDSEAFTQGTSIPMWGEKMTTLNLRKGEATELTEPVYLLRAMAKVEVMVAEGVGELQSVTVDKYNQTGYVLPKFPETFPEGYDGTEDLDQDAVFNPNTTTPETDLRFTPSINGGFYVYLPEYQNVGEGASPAQMTVQIDDKTYPLEFKIYDDESNDKYFNIVRNHYYQYIITGVADDAVSVKLSLQYQVIDWKEVDKNTLEFN